MSGLVGIIPILFLLSINPPETIDGFTDRFGAETRLQADYLASFYREPVERLLEEMDLCLIVEDDPQTVLAFDDLVLSDEPVRNFLSQESLAFLRKKRDGSEILPGKDVIARFEYDSEGHITLRYPSRFTVQALADVWRINPCSHGAIFSLIRMAILLQGTDPGMFELSFLDHVSRPYFPGIIFGAVANNYPLVWESDYAANRFKFEDGSRDMFDFDGCHRIIRNFEADLFYADRYFRVGQELSERFAFGDVAAIRETPRHVFSAGNLYINAMRSLEQGYSFWCAVKGAESIKETGALSEAVIYYYHQTHYWHDQLKRKNPDFTEWHKLPNCYRLIKEHAPKEYQGDPILSEDPYQKARRMAEEPHLKRK